MSRKLCPSLRTRGFAALTVAGIVCLALAASADDQDNVLVMRAADLESQGRCAEAVEVLRSAPTSVDPRLMLIAGRCQVRLKEYGAAVDTLLPARDLPDASPEVDLYIGVSQYHLGLLDDARTSLGRAEARGQEGALLELYTGLLKLAAEDSRGAALALERARRADSRAVEPVASYYAWLAWRSAEDEERAEAALARLREEDPDGPWIAEAERRLAGEPSQTPTFWFNGEAGLEYDTNVSIRGGGGNQVFINGDVVSDKEDGRGIWSFDGGSELFRNESWSGGVLGSYTGTAHFDISEFDAHYPLAGAWLDHHFSPETTLRGRYDIGHAWVNYDPYMLANVLSATLFHSWDVDSHTELTFAAGFYDFKYEKLNPPLRDRGAIDEDGTRITLEALHRFPVEIEDLEARIGYRFIHFDSDGREFDYSSHRLLAGFDVTLPLEIAWDTWTSFTYQPYRHASVYASPAEIDRTRRDRVWEFGTELEKFVAENVSVLARYRYIDTGSNTDVYDYDRHVVGAYVRLRFR